MPLMRNITAGIRSLFRRRSVDRELDEELSGFLEMAVEAKMKQGMSTTDAVRAVRLERGSLDISKDTVRSAGWESWVEAFWQDLGFGIRLLRKNFGFTSVAVLTLALGIGANIAIFSMVNALLLHPYTFRNLDGLIRIWENRGIDQGFDDRWIAWADAQDFRSSTDVFESLATYRYRNFNLAIEGTVEPVLGCRVSASFFDVLGVSPAAGRGFVVSEEQPGEDQVVILSEGFWKRRFGGDPKILGKTIRMTDRDYTVVGIMPAKFSYPVPSELWVPLALTPEEKVDRSRLSVMALGRLKSGMDISTAKVAIATYARRLEQEYPSTNAGRTAMALQLRKELYLYTLPLFLLLQTAAAFVLLLACANLANLMFARMLGRQKEIAMRSALGAGGRRLAQLFVCETMLVSILGASVAAIVSLWSVRFLRTSISQGWTKWVAGWDNIQVDRNVLLFTVLLATLVGIFFGLATVMHARRMNLSKTLKEAGPGSLSPYRGKLRSALVVVQVILALVLLVFAGLSVQGFRSIAKVYAGFQPANVLKAEIALPEKSYGESMKVVNFYQQILETTGAMAGVEHVALATNLPASNVDNETTFFTMEARPPGKLNETPSADLLTVSPDYFRTLRIPLITGRVFAESDNSHAEQVVLISRSMAAQYWANDDVLGKRFKLGKADSAEPWLKVIGVVGDVRQNWWSSPVRPAIYRTFLQDPQRSMSFVLRANADPMAYVAQVRAVVQKLDAGVALQGVNSFENEVADSIAIIRILGTLMGAFGLVALTLSSVGIYGVLSESVAQRTREIGIRVALGADARDLTKLIIGQAMKLTAIGLVVGLPLSFVLSRVIASQIYGVVTVDFAIFAGFTMLLVAVAFVAACLPARRALRIDPIVALRYE
jgi:putative ABC transport system permease protein